MRALRRAEEAGQLRIQIVGNGVSYRMTGEPDAGVGVHEGHVVVKVLIGSNPC